MTTIEKVFHVSTSMSGIINKGSEVPKWKDNFNVSNWWYNGNQNTNYFYSTNGDSTFIQYGQNLSNYFWASSRFFGQTVTILNEEEQTDGSISGTVRVTPDFFSGRRTEYARPTGYAVEYSIKIHNEVIYTFKGQTIDEFTNGKGKSVEFDFNVKPEETYTDTCLEINIRYPNGEYENSRTRVGIALKNPNKPSYRPMAIRKSGVMVSLNSKSGFLKIRKSGAFKDIPLQNIADSGKENKGTSRARKSGKWLQQSLKGVIK